MRGTNASTGKALSGLDHLKQSIRVILTTPKGSRVMNREFGSRLFELIDAPLNNRTVVDFYAATVEALLRWETRIRPQSFEIMSSIRGKVVMSMTAIYLETGQAFRMDGLVIAK